VPHRKREKAKTRGARGKRGRPRGPTRERILTVDWSLLGEDREEALDAWMESLEPAFHHVLETHRAVLDEVVAEQGRGRPQGPWLGARMAERAARRLPGAA
jgi:hypothetical protein